MKPPAFEYSAPATLDEALALTAEHGFDAKLLAGGQSLIPLLNFRLAAPARLIDLNRLSELAGITASADGGLHIGAMTRQRAVERNRLVAERAPLLAEAMPLIAHPQIRNRGTIGGSLAHADPASELPVVAVALDAHFEIRRQGERRRVAARDFYVGLMTTDLAAEEILTAIELPPTPPRTGFAFVELARRHGDYAHLGLAATVSLDADGRCRAARLVYLGGGDVPTEASQAAASLLGEYPSAERIAAAAAAAPHELEPTGDIHASEDYKKHLAGVLTRRALTRAAERAAATPGGTAPR